MKFRFLIVLFALLLCVSLSAQSTAERAGERAKNRAETRANSKVDQKVDGAVDDAFNAVGNLFKKKNKKKKKKGTGATETPSPEAPRATNGTGGIFGGATWVPYTNPISFSLRMEITELKKNGKESTAAFNMASVPTEFGILIEDEEAQETSRMILNTQDGKTTMITTDKQGRKEGFRMKMPGLRQHDVEAAEAAVEHITIEQTTETRVIDGYNCLKYIVKDSENNITTESWVTTEAGLNAQDIYGGMMNAFGAKAKKQGSSTNALAGGYEGFPILTISNDGKSTFTCQYTNLKVGEDNIDKSVLDITGIPVQSVGF